MTTETKPYRGQTSELDLDFGEYDRLSWWAVATTEDEEIGALELAERYTDHLVVDGESHIYRATLNAKAARGGHEDFDNDFADTEGSEWLLELLRDLGADYIQHTEGGVTTIGILPERLRDVLVDLEYLASDDPWDGWTPVQTNA